MAVSAGEPEVGEACEYDMGSDELALDDTQEMPTIKLPAKVQQTEKAIEEMTIKALKANLDVIDTPGALNKIIKDMVPSITKLKLDGYEGRLRRDMNYVIKLPGRNSIEVRGGGRNNRTHLVDLIKDALKDADSNMLEKFKTNAPDIVRYETGYSIHVEKNKKGEKFVVLNAATKTIISLNERGEIDKLGVTVPYRLASVIHDEHTHVKGIIDTEEEPERYYGDIEALRKKMKYGIYRYSEKHGRKRRMFITEFDEEGNIEIKTLYAERKQDGSRSYSVAKMADSIRPTFFEEGVEITGATREAVKDRAIVTAQIWQRKGSVDKAADVFEVDITLERKLTTDAGRTVRPDLSGALREGVKDIVPPIPPGEPIQPIGIGHSALPGESRVIPTGSAVVVGYTAKHAGEYASVAGMMRRIEASGRLGDISIALPISSVYDGRKDDVKENTGLEDMVNGFKNTNVFIIARNRDEIEQFDRLMNTLELDPERVRCIVIKSDTVNTSIITDAIRTTTGIEVKPKQLAIGVINNENTRDAIQTDLTTRAKQSASFLIEGKDARFSANASVVAVLSRLVTSDVSVLAVGFEGTELRDILRYFENLNASIGDIIKCMVIRARDFIEDITTFIISSKETLRSL